MSLLYFAIVRALANNTSTYVEQSRVAMPVGCCKVPAKHCVRMTFLTMCCVKVHLRCGCNALVLPVKLQCCCWGRGTIHTYELVVFAIERVIANNTQTDVEHECGHTSVLLQDAHETLRQSDAPDSVLR